MSFRWGDEKTLKFIALYRENECLWNSKSTVYKDKTARDYAYSAMLQEMDDPNLTIQDVKNKIKGLRSTYHQELNKVRYSKLCAERDGANEIYTPNLIWFTEMEFLNETLEYRRNKAAGLSVPEAEDLGQLGSSFVTTQYQTNSNQSTNDASNNPEEVQRPLKRSVLTRKKLNRKFRKPILMSSSERSNETLAALQRLENTVANISQQSRPSEDEFYYFGLSVAAQLRALPLRIALNMQSEIQKLLSTERRQINEFETQNNTASFSNQNPTQFPKTFPPFP